MSSAIRALLSAILISLLSSVTGAAKSSDWLVIENGTVIDVKAGKAVPGQSVTIRGPKIVAVGEVPENVPEDAERYAAGGKFIIPGLWDMHVHALWHEDVVDPFFTLFVAHGVTGVRDMGGKPELLKSVVEGELGRNAWTPLLYVAGPILDGPEPLNPDESIALATPKAGRDAVRKLKEWGVDFAKVYTTLPPPVFKAVARAARDHDLGLAGHLPAGIPIGEAAAAGMRSIEHMVTERGGYCPATNRTDCAEKFRLLKGHGIHQTPTLVVRHRRSFVDAPGHDYADKLRLVPPFVQTYWQRYRERRAAEPVAQKKARRADYDHTKWMAAALIETGVPMLAGTDAGLPFVLPGLSLHEELQRLVIAGMSPAQALRTATLEAAQFTGFEFSGQVAPGMMADLVILRRNPLERIRYTASIEAVVRFGHLHRRAELDAEIERLRKQ
ncbi:MAG: amidohydrolase family protein [Alphaproteobacteria bacterium]